MKTVIASLALLGALSAPMAAQARSPMMPRITEAYAKRIALKAVREQNMGRFPYKVTLDPAKGNPLRRTFTAEVNWGKRPHIMIAVPTYRGSIDMGKYSGKKGLNRVNVATRGWLPNH